MNASIEGLRTAIYRRMRLQTDEGGVAMVTVILFMIMLSGISLVLLGVIVGQLGPAYAAQKSTKTIYSAQAGLQSALGAIRSATKIVPVAKVVGDISKLPCEIRAQVDGEADSVAYRVDVGYYLENPEGRSEAWLNSPANKLTCTNGAGVSTQPNYAYIVSSGLGESAAGRDASESNRSVAAVYKFKVLNLNIAGGRIFDDSRTNCLQAQTAAVGSKVRFVSSSSCGEGSSASDRQLWVYSPDWKIKLASSIVDPGAPGLCITGRTGENSNYTELRTCVTSGTDHTKQLWGWNDSAGWNGRNASNNANSGCLNRETVSSVPYLKVTSACAAFSPTPAVGAGAASYSTGQVVNYAEFGRCLDVTDREIDKAFMISYPCKQDPSGAGGFSWNHKWAYTEPDIAGGAISRAGTIVVRTNSTNYCLTTQTSGVPRFYGCTSANPTAQNQVWTRVYNTGEYESSYLFTDRNGNCLTADANDKYNGDWSKIKVATCDGSEQQKWNAPPRDAEESFGDFKETAGYRELG
jgi:hypothetical protein